MNSLIVLLGPTASGKTQFAIELARHFDTEILNADSRQFYRGLNIGTAKPAPADMTAIKHHFVDSLSPEEEYNIDLFEKDALDCLSTIFNKHEVAILTGGSGLYIDSVCKGIDELPGNNPDLRQELNELFRTKGIEALQEKLQMLDPEHFHSIDKQNTHRLIRAIEVCMLSGKKYSELRTRKKKERPFRFIKIGILIEKDHLNRRIDVRVDEMIKAGLGEEVKHFFPLRNLNSLKTVGYQELFEHFENKISLEEAIEKIKTHTRQYAKRQMTWFKKDKSIHWFRPGIDGDISVFAQNLMRAAST